jgi:hypothetical protein
MRKIILLLLLTSTLAQAQWASYVFTPESDYEVNNELITHHDNNGKVFQVWTRTTTKNTTIIAHREIHCASRHQRIFYSIMFNNTNQIEYRDDNPKWLTVVPNSADAVLLDYICTNFK